MPAEVGRGRIPLDQKHTFDRAISERRFSLLQTRATGFLFGTQTHMAITKAKKESLLASAKDVLSKTSSVAFVAFRGLTVAEVNELRAGLKKEGVKYTVVKKTLLKKALDSGNVEGTMPELPGEVAFAYLKEGDDVTAPARTLQIFVKKFKEKLSLLGGVIEKKYLSLQEVKVVATIPATPVLRGMFVNVINSPIQRFAIALSEVAKTKSAA